MKRLLKLFGIVGILLMVFAGCGKQPIYNIPQASVIVKKGTENDAVYKAIKQAAISKGWVVSKVSDGVAQASINLRKHSASVKIKYDTNEYSITYLSSTNLDEEDGKIHSNYNGWIMNLKQAIDVQLSILGE